jgi:hypothetical protein
MLQFWFRILEFRDRRRSPRPTATLHRASITSSFRGSIPYPKLLESRRRQARPQPPARMALSASRPKRRKPPGKCLGGSVWRRRGVMGQLAVAYTHAPRRPIDCRVRDSHQWLSKDISIARSPEAFSPGVLVRLLPMSCLPTLRRKPDPVPTAALPVPRAFDALSTRSRGSRWRLIRLGGRIDPGCPGDRRRSTRASPVATVRLTLAPGLTS